MRLVVDLFHSIEFALKRARLRVHAISNINTHWHADLTSTNM